MHLVWRLVVSERVQANVFPKLFEVMLSMSSTYVLGRCSLTLLHNSMI